MEHEITRSFNRNDYVDDEEEEDVQLAHARYQSLDIGLNMTNGSIEQAGVHIMMKEAVVDHQVFPKCVDQLLFEKLAQEDQRI